MRNYILPSFLALGLLTGCDIISAPKGDRTGPTGPGAGVTRRVLLEDCTGHLCNNCPAAADIAEDLKDVYGDRLVIVAVHLSTTFAAPQPPLGDGIFDDDFRTEAGNAYEQQFSIDGLPKGMINRTPYNSPFAPMNKDNWGSALAQLIDLPASVDLWIDTLSYNTGTHTITATVKAAVLSALPAPQNLTIYLTESHIIGWQIDNRVQPDPNVPDYEFNHVLRGALNSPWGQSFLSQDAQVGDTVETTFSYPLPSNVLVPGNCSVVAYVYNGSGADQYEVQQVTERKLVP